MISLLERVVRDFVNLTNLKIFCKEKKRKIIAIETKKVRKARELVVYYYDAVLLCTCMWLTRDWNEKETSLMEKLLNSSNLKQK